MWRTYVIFIALFLLDLTQSKEKFSDVITINRFEKCKNEPGLWVSHSNIRKYNRTVSVINGNVTFDRDVDDSLNLFITVSRWGDGGWKKNFMNFQMTKACSSLLYILPDVIKYLLDVLKLPAKCPIPKGHYTFPDISTQIVVSKLIRNIGKYWTVFKIIDRKTKDVLVCYDIILSNNNN